MGTAVLPQLAWFLSWLRLVGEHDALVQIIDFFFMYNYLIGTTGGPLLARDHDSKKFSRNIDFEKERTQEHLDCHGWSIPET